MKREAGMTLIEVMVALVIFALAGLAVMQSTLQQTRQLGRMEEKSSPAGWRIISWCSCGWRNAGLLLAGPKPPWRPPGRAGSFAGKGWKPRCRNCGRWTWRSDGKKRSRAAGDPAHLGDAAMITKMRGFTLIETLLALAILAVLSAAAVMVLQNVIRADGLTREKSQQIAALQRAFRQIADDVTHIIPRRARNSDTLFFAGRFQLQSDDWGLAFSRSGWPNPLGDPAALGDPERQLPSAPAAA